LQLLWGAALVVTLGALPVGAVRMIAYRSGEVDHTRTMRIAAYVAVALGAAGLVTLAVTSALLFTCPRTPMDEESLSRLDGKHFPGRRRETPGSTERNSRVNGERLPGQRGWLPLRLASEI
jgi:hypothetical protein